MGRARAAEAKAAKDEKQRQLAQADDGAAAQKQREAREKRKAAMKQATDGVLAKVMADPELAKMIEHSPKLQGIVEEVKDNPMSGLKYMSDPDVAPFMKKAMAKIMPGGLPGLGESKGGKGAGRGKGAGGGGADLGGLADMMKGFGAGGDS